VAAWEVHDVATASAPVEELVQTIGQSLQRRLDISAGPIQCAAFLDFGASRPGRLVLVSHHLAVDAVSYRILLEDIEAFARSRLTGAEPQPFAGSASIIDWSEMLVRAAQGDRVRGQLPFWLRQCEQASALPLDRPDGRHLERFSRTATVTLAREDTEHLLRLAPQKLRTELPELLLTALLGALGPRIAGDYVRIEVEGHGREPIADAVDTSRTVGWFTSLFPVRFRLGRAGWRDTLTEVKDTWRSVPDRGVGYGMLRYLSPWPEARALADAPRPNIAFNYLGQFDHVLSVDAVLQPAEEPYGDLYDGENERPYALQVVGAVRNGALRMQWIHSTEQLDASTIDAIASRFISELSQIARALDHADTSHVSPSDFPDAGLTSAELDRILSS
jgi:non-ribosomal peptide synthase protein (TIGR01720 family)